MKEFALRTWCCRYSSMIGSVSNTAWIIDFVDRNHSYPFPKQQGKSLKNNVRKGEIARTKQFPHFSCCFVPCWRTFPHCNRISICCLQTLSVLKSLKFVVWERLREGLVWVWGILLFVKQKDILIKTVSTLYQMQILSIWTSLKFCCYNFTILFMPWHRKIGGHIVLPFLVYPSVCLHKHNMKNLTFSRYSLVNLVTRLIFGMKAHLINTHPVPRSRWSAKVKVKHQGHVSQKMDVSGGISFSQTHLVIGWNYETNENALSNIWKRN